MLHFSALDLAIQAGFLALLLALVVLLPVFKETMSAVLIGPVVI